MMNGSFWRYRLERISEKNSSPASKNEAGSPLLSKTRKHISGAKESYSTFFKIEEIDGSDHVKEIDIVK